jgi:hypothetical protein
MRWVMCGASSGALPESPEQSAAYFGVGYNTVVNCNLGLHVPFNAAYWIDYLDSRHDCLLYGRLTSGFAGKMLSTQPMQFALEFVQ